MPSFQNDLVDYLKANGASPIIKIASNLGTSVGYVRTQLKALEYAGTIRRVDERTPIYYEISPESATAKYDKEITLIKEKLLGDKEPRNEILACIWNMSKAEWEQNLILLKALGPAVEEIVKSGKAIDTL